MTWNVQHASRERGARQASWLASRPEADVVTLTEVSAGRSGEELAMVLRGLGYDTLLASDPLGGDYRVLLASRVGRLEPAEIPIRERPHRLPAANIVFRDGHRLGLVGIYVPSRGPRQQRNVAKRAFQMAVVEILSDVHPALGTDQPILIAGDLNVIEPGHSPAHTVFGRWEFDFYEAFAAAGFADAFRLRNPELIDHSWYGRSGAGYRFDHMFCDSAYAEAVRDCRYLHEPLTLRLSDHAALYAEIDIHSSS